VVYTSGEMATNCSQAGHGFVLCDAGGGTVDLISYEVTHVNPLQLKEVSHATGDS
jgi:hypothetical protein